MDAFMGTILPWAIRFAPYGFSFCDGKALAINQYNAVYSLLATTFGGNGSTTFLLPDLRGRTMLGAGQALAAGSSNFVIGQTGGAESASIALTANNIPAHTHSATFTAVTGTQSVTIPAQSATGSLAVTAALNGTTATGSAAAPTATGSNYLGGLSVVDSKATALPSKMYATAAGTAAPIAGLAVGVTTGTYTAATPAIPVSLPTVTGGTVTVMPAGPTTQTAVPVKTMSPYLTLNFMICLNGIYPTPQ